MSGFPPLGEWSNRSACAGVDPELFFEKDLEQDAKIVCRQCTVQDDCLSYALQYNPSGVWAGTNPADRRRLRRRLILTPREPVVVGERPDARRVCPSCSLLVVTIPGPRDMEECSACGATFFGGRS